MFSFVVAVSLLALSSAHQFSHRGKWPCRIENLDDEILREIPCRDGGDDTCTIGPILKTWMGEEKNIYMCNPPAEKRQLMLEHACRVVSDGVDITPDSGEDESNDCDQDDECIVGPFDAILNEETVQFYKCSRHKRRGGRGPCKAVDDEGNIVKQRECSCGADQCTRGPEEKEWRGETYTVTYCECEDEGRRHGRHRGHRRGHRGGRGGRHGNRDGWRTGGYKGGRRGRGHNRDDGISVESVELGDD